MTNIKLTEDHRSKLLKMVKVLFPEIKILSGVFSDGSKCPDYILDYPVDLEWGTEWDLPYISVGTEEIHWFEFCMTHLSIAIYRKLFDFSASNGYITADTGEEHSYEWSANFYRNVLFLIMNPDRITDIKTKWHPVDYLYEEFLKLN